MKSFWTPYNNVVIYSGTREIRFLCSGATLHEDCWNDKYFWERRLYSRDPVEEIASGKPDVLINISASPYACGKRAFRLKMLRAIARRYRVPVIFANLAGGNDSLVFDGSSLVLDGTGEIRAQAKSFHEDVIIFDTDRDTKDIHPQQNPNLRLFLMPWCLVHATTATNVASSGL